MLCCLNFLLIHLALIHLYCSHCYGQKEAFGAEAMASFPYVECYPNGWRKVGALW